MEKVELRTADIAAENAAKLAELFPDIVTEVLDEDGNVRHSIDVEALKAHVGDIAEDKRERYQFTWPGKQKARAEAIRPIDKTMRPCPEESVNWGTTENLYIEGDNLDALKILRETYAGKIKMIYIDPPYNTGHDFIYKDNFARTAEEERAESGAFGEEGSLLDSAFVVNSEADGRFHSSWCSMLYPRLVLARDVLQEDGVIFISIDDCEQAHLKAICDEAFGASNFVTTIHCQLSTTQGMKVKAAKEGNIVKNGEYVLCYSKDGHKNIARQPLYDLREKYDEHYSLYLREDGTIGQLRELYDYRFPNDCSNDKPYSLSEAYRRSNEFAEIVRTHLAEIVRSDKTGGLKIDVDLKPGAWREVDAGARSYILTVDKKGGLKQLLRLSDSWGPTDGFYGEEGLRKIRGDWWDGFYIDMGNVSKEGDMEYKNGKKPVRLILQLAKMVTEERDIVLDFFSGSATTAHAVMQLNAEDGGNRKFIMVQLPEVCDEKSEAAKAGYENICEIGKERIRRAGAKIASEVEESNAQLKLGEEPKRMPDIGFRVLKIDSSNFEDVQRTPDTLFQDALFSLADNVKPGRTPEDILFQLFPKLEIPYTARIDTFDICGKTVYSVDDDTLVACFDREVPEDVVRAMAEREPAWAVLRDASFTGDDALANFEEIFKTLSPETKTRVV